MYIHIDALLCAVLAMALAGCATTRDVAWPEARPLGEPLAAYRPPAQPDEAPSETPTPTWGDPLTLGEALAQALLHNPDLRAFAWEVRAREARTLQAGLLPNPEFRADIENFNGTGSLGRLDAAEVTFGLSHLIELGGDRLRRKQVAAGERNLAGWDYETVRLDVLTETAQAFAAVLAAQERVRIADSLQLHAEQFYETVAARVDAGKVSSLEERRASVVLASARIATTRANSDLLRKRTRLAAAWGRSEPAFGLAVGTLSISDRLPSYAEVSRLIERNPDIARWRDEMALLRADVALEKAARIPDPVLGLGARRLRDLGANAFTAGLSIPLPLFNRNQGALREAEYRVQAAEALRVGAEVAARSMLADAYQRLAMADAEVEALRDAVLPAASESFTATQEGYREGKFDLLTVLDVQRTFFEAMNQYIDALEAYQFSLADVERMIGTPLSEL